MDLTSTYLGLTLKNPLVASSSPLNLDLDNIMRLEDSGAAAVVLPSIFEEQLEREAAEIERLTTAGSHSFAEAVSFFTPTASYRAGPHNYLETIRRAREAVEIPVIASLNGTTDAGWTNFARLTEEAGASAIELNVFFIPADLSLSGRAVEQRYLDVLRAVRKTVRIPIAVKLRPYFSSVGHFVSELDQAGADGFVLFNRFYEPDIDLAKLRLQRDLELSTPSNSSAAPMDRCAVGPRARLACGKHRGGDRRASGQISLGRRRRGDDDVGVVAPRRRPHAEFVGRPHAVAWRARFRLNSGNSRQDEPALRQGSDGVRTRKLHSHSSRLAAVKQWGDRGRRYDHLLVQCAK